MQLTKDGKIKKFAAIIDIDGTLANSKHREHHIVNPEGKVDWDSWDAACHLDTPNEWCQELVAALWGWGIQIIFLTGRGERIRQQTQDWLAKHVGDFTRFHTPLLMRKAGDRRPDTVIKEEYIKNEIEPNYKVLFAVDDRDTVVDSMRKLGLTVLHCDRWGDEKEKKAQKWLDEPDGSYRREIMRTCNPEFLDNFLEMVSCGGLGIAGEAGEVADLAKKFLHHSKREDINQTKFNEKYRDKMIKELGDVRWYLELLAFCCGVSMQEIERRNVEKLRERFKSGFTPEAAAAKADEKKS